MATGRKPAPTLRRQAAKPLGSSAHQSALNTIYEFCRALDHHDWEALRRCLAATVDTDYSSFRGTSPARMNADEFVALRRTGLAGLSTQHLTLNHLLTVGRAEISCHFEFIIHRWPEDPGDTRFFHTFGTYEVTLRRALPAPHGWAIRSITQRVWRSEGDPELHGAHRAPVRNQRQ